MKKSLALLLILVMVISVGCGNSDTSETSEDGVVVVETKVEGESESFEYTGKGPITDSEDATLSMLAMNSWYTNADLAEAGIVNEVVNRAGIEMEWQLLTPTNYQDSVSPMLAAGQGLADIVQLPNLDENMNYIESGLFLPIDGYIEEFGVNIKKYFDENPEVKASLTADDGHIYYVPQGVVTENFQPCSMVNVEWLDTLGLETPSTLDELVSVLRAFRDEDPNGNGEQDEIPLSIQSKFVPYMFGPAFGLDLVSTFQADENGIVSYGFYTENFREYVTFLNSLYEEGLLETEFASLTRDQIVQRLSQDITGFTYDFSWQMSQSYSSVYDSYNGEEGVIVGIPPLSSDDYEGFYVGRNPVSGIFGITKDSENPALAFKFLDYAVSEECQDMYVWGFEGETYEVVDGVKQYTEKAKDNTYLQQLGINPVCLPSRQSVEATDVLLPEWHVNIDNDMVQYMKAPWPFIYATSEESDVISQYMTDIITYVDEMTIKFITGTEDLSQFDNYINTLKNMNIEEIIKIKQAQYDRYQSATN